MDKNIIKKQLAQKFLSEVTTPAISLNNKIKKDNSKINKSGVSSEAKDSLDYNDSLKQDKETSKMAPNKFNYGSAEEEAYHGEMEIMNGQEMVQYDNEPDEMFKKRAKEAIEGSSKMGNNPEWANVVPKQQGFEGPEFGKNLVKRIKASVDKRNNQTPTTKMYGDDWETTKSLGAKPRAIQENNNNNKPQIKESMKRLRFKNEFKGLGNALKLIPEAYKVDNKVFEMTDGNESYKIRWEGNLSEGKAIILTASDKNLVNEDINKMKHLFGYKSQDTLGLLKGNARLDENKVFADIWSKSRALMTESEDIESAKAGEGNWEDETKKAPEATKHVQGSVSKDKGTQAPAAKEGNVDKAVSQAPEAKKHVESGSSKASTAKPKEGNWESVKGGEKMMEIEAPTPKEGHWEDAGINQAAEAKKHIHLKESDEETEEETMEETFDVMKETEMPETLEELYEIMKEEDDDDFPKGPTPEEAANNQVTEEEELEED